MFRYLRLLTPLVVLAGLVAHGLPVVQGQTTGGASSSDPLDTLHFRSIGPASMSGRIADLSVFESNPAVYYVGTAHGGVWKTTSNGVTFEAQFQNEGLISIGDVTVSQQNPDLVWVGTGEASNRQSKSWGNGVYKSTDGGATWTHMGLSTTRHVNRILIHPRNNDVVYVASPGSVWGPGGERGVYKTTDGGRTWRQVLRVNDDTGADDLAMSAVDPDIMFASSYQRRRSQCCFNGGGPGSGLWKSTDGGETWNRIEGNGWPAGPLGRIAVDTFRQSPNLVYALVEGEAGGGRGGGGGGGAAGGGRGAGAGGGAPASVTGFYRSDDGGTTWRQMSTNNPRPMYFSQIAVDPTNPDRIYAGGVGLQMSIDGGRTWETDAAQQIHDDKHAIWVNPANPNHILIGGDGGIAVSYDMSRTWQQLPNLPLALYYHVAVDNAVPFNVCGGLQDNYNWCGPSRTRFSRGILNQDWYQVQGGDGFVVLVDQLDPRYVYSESQNGNIQRKNRLTGESRNIRPNNQTVTPETQGGYRFNWDTPMIFSPHNPGRLIVAAHRVFTSDDRGDSWTVISPDLTTNADRDEIETMGLRGNEIRIATNDGITSWPTLVSLAESPRQAGVYYTGSDDGVVSMSSDAGKTWTNITDRLPGFPRGGWVSEVVPSRHQAGTVYVTVDAHRINDFKTYIWASDDMGQTFRSLNANLSGEVVKTLLEDPKTPDLLYIGTETGVFITLDRGQSWRRLKANLPTVRVDEMVIHPRDNALVVGTHGRAVWVLDNAAPIQEFAAAQAASRDATLFSIAPALQWRPMDNQNDEFWGHQIFVGENPPGDAMIQFHLKRKVGDLKLRIADSGGRQVRELEVSGDDNAPGIQTVCWDMRVQPIEGGPGGGAPGRGGRGGGGRGGRGGAVPDVPQPAPPAGSGPWNPCGGGGFGGGGGSIGPLVLPGAYTVSLVVDGTAVDSKPMTGVLDPANQLSDAARRRYYDMTMELHELHRRGAAVADALQSVHTQMTDIGQKLPGMSNVPDAVKGQFEMTNKEFATVRERFGVPQAAPAAGGGRGGGGRGGGAPVSPANVLARLSGVKGQVLTFYDMPSDSVMRQVTSVRAEMPKAITEANAMLGRLTTLSQALAKHNVTLTVPPPVR